jgi:hypothetical protein
MTLWLRCTCIQVHYKQKGSCTALILPGGFPADWNAACGAEPRPTPLPEPPQPLPSGDPNAPASCGYWRVRLWQLDGGSGSLKSVSLWVRHWGCWLAMHDSACVRMLAMCTSCDSSGCRTFTRTEAQLLCLCAFIRKKHLAHAQHLQATSAAHASHSPLLSCLVP